MEQLTTDGGAEPVVEPTKPKPRPCTHYLKGNADYGALTMASDEAKRKAVRKLFPESEYTWHEDESTLWNWVNAHAERYFDGDYSKARQMVNGATDPIFGGRGYRDIAKFVWFLA